MNFIITTKHPEFGKGYFCGFKNGHPYFQSGIDCFAKRYATIRNANKQLQRILDHSPDSPGEDTKVESTNTLPNISDLLRDPRRQSSRPQIGGEPG